MTKRDYVIHSSEEIAGIREAAAVTATVLRQITGSVRPGMTTKALDELAGRFIKNSGGESAFLGYRGFPGQICISVNDEVVHGIGKLDKVLREKDLVSIDIGIKYKGFIGDTCRSFAIGEATPEIASLLDTTRESLNAGIRAALPGNYIRDISAAIEKLARAANLGIVREYVGHGCGVELHEPPEIPNFVTRSKGPKLVPGMVLAIEPMLNLGTHKVFTEPDNWTVKTVDGKVSAHFEHMVLITDNEPEILTWPRKS